MSQDEDPTVLERLGDWLYDPADLMDSPDEPQEPAEQGGIAGVWNNAKDWAVNEGTQAVETNYINKIPGAGVLFNYDSTEGLSFTPAGRVLLMVGAAYGLFRFMGR